MCMFSFLSNNKIINYCSQLVHNVKQLCYHMDNANGINNINDINNNEIDTIDNINNSDQISSEIFFILLTIF